MINDRKRKRSKESYVDVLFDTDSHYFRVTVKKAKGDFEIWEQEWYKWKLRNGEYMFTKGQNPKRLNKPLNWDLIVKKCYEKS